MSRKVVNGKSDFTTLATALSAKKHPSYQVAEDLRYDLGILDFPKQSWPHFVKISQKAVRENDQVTMVGYGHNEVSANGFDYELYEKGAGVKRLGTNKVLTKEPGIFKINGQFSEKNAAAKGVKVGDEAGMGGGDSGGPVFNDKGELVGIASSQYFHWESVPRIRAIDSIYVDLSSEESQSFLSTHMR